MKLFITSFILAAAVASAAPIDQVKFINAGNPLVTDSKVKIDGVTKYGVAIGPYTLSVNGHNTAALCIDFFDDTNSGDVWSAYVSQVGGNISSTLHPTYGQEYEEDAYLFSQIIKPGSDRTDLQIAAWDIMAYGITSSSYTSVVPYDKTIYADIDAALANYNKINLAGFEILTDTVNGCDQEFMIGVPEPGNLALLGLGVLATGLGLVRRRRAAAAQAV
jgi:PEP-CTERM motif